MGVSAGVCMRAALPGDNDSWYCDVDRADSRERRYSLECSASCRCTTGSQMVPMPFAVASPACGTWRVDSETKPAKGHREREKDDLTSIKALPDL